MRNIKKIHDSHYAPIQDLITYSPLPSESIDHVDPFLLINHHGPQVYKPGNNGLPFGPHPHRGMETVTFIIDGDIFHRDSGDNKGTILPGGVQYMSAGKGLIHAEVSSDDFKAKGGNLEILQLWLNMPAKNKMDEPHYKDLQKDDIPKVKEGNATIDVLSGEWKGQKGAFQTPSGISLYTLYLENGSNVKTTIPKDHNIFFYMVRGRVDVNGKTAEMRQMVEFNDDDTTIEITAGEESIIILGHAAPFHEPIVSRGPFVMNSEMEINQAYADYQSGKFGTWKY